METRKKWADLDYAEKKALAEIYRANNINSVLHLYNTKPGTLIRRIQEWIKFENDRQGAVVNSINIPESPTRKFTDFTVLEGLENYIVISDTEIPDYDHVMLKLALLTAIRYDIKTLIWAGDILATDQTSLNSWLPTWVTGSEINYEGAVGITNNLLYQFGNHFDQIEIIMGNHDGRLSRRTGGELWLAMVLDRTRANYSRYEYLYVRNSRGLTKICHPENYSSTPVALGQQLYDVEAGPLPGQMEKAHIVLAHTHIQQSGWSKDGSHEVHALGTTRDPYRTQYKMTKANKHHQWSQSFLMFRDGYFQPMTRKGVNWRDVLGQDLYAQSGL